MPTYKIIILVLLFFQGQSFAQKSNFNQAKMDSLFILLAQEDKAMGSLAIWESNKRVYQRAIGLADMEKAQKARPDTRYRIGSISKTFTAVLIMQLVEQGKLSLDTPLANFFPKFKNADAITVEHLLRHRSGLPNFTDAPDFATWMSKDISREDLLKKILSPENDFAPNEKAAYSNTNYVLLTMIIEQVYQKDFDPILQMQICQPLGLKATYLGGKIDPNKQEARPYQKLNEWLPTPETHPSVPLGAGAIVSTPNDLCQFFTALFEGKLLSQQSLEQMQTLVEDYGMGLFKYPFHEKYAFGHTGGIDGFQSIAAYFPEEKVAIAYTSNGVDIPRNDILIGALSIYFGRDYTLPNFKAFVVNEEVLETYVGTYASTQIPLKMKIYREGKQLFGQATGQSAFPLEAYETHKFRFQPAGLEIIFAPETKTLRLQQGGQSFTFSRED